MIVRLTIVVMFDTLTCETIPLYLYQTKDLDVHQDFFIKRLSAMFLIGTQTMSPLENYL